MLEDDAARNREAHELLQYLASTLLSRVGALKYTATAKSPPLRYDDIVVVSALAFPLSWSDEPVRYFLKRDPVMCRRVITFAAENHVRVQSFIKAGESRSRPSRRVEAPQTEPAAAAVESIFLVAKFLCGEATSFDALLVDLGESSGGGGGGGAVEGVTALRLELHRALSNFLLRHMFFRMSPDATELRKLPKPLFVHVDMLPAWPVAPTFRPGGLPSLPHDVMHDVKSSEDPIVHALINVFGFAVRSLSSSSQTAWAVGGGGGGGGAVPRHSASRSRSGSPQSALSPSPRSSTSFAGSNFAASVSLGKIPVEQSTFFDNSAAAGSRADYQEDDEDDGGGDCPSYGGGLPWQQLMEDLKFLAGACPNPNDGGGQPLRPLPTALSFYTIGSADAIEVQLREGPNPTLPHVAATGVGDATAGPKMTRVAHFGSSLLSIGLETLLLTSGRSSRSYPSWAEHVGNEFHLSTAHHPDDVVKQGVSPSSARLENYLSVASRYENDIAFGVVRSLPHHALRIAAENVLGLAAATASEAAAGRSIFGMSSTGSSADGSDSSVLALRRLKILLVRLAVQAASLGLQELLTEDVLGALKHCPAELAQCGDAPFLQLLFLALKEIVEGVKPGKGGRGAGGVARALEAVRLLSACGARPSSRQDAHDHHHHRGTGALLHLVITAPGTTTASPQQLPEADYDAVEVASDDAYSNDGSPAGIGTTWIVVSCDMLVAAVGQQLRWLGLRRVEGEAQATLRAALDELQLLLLGNATAAPPRIAAHALSE